MAEHSVADKAFLDLFPRNERSTVANVFLNGIRREGAVNGGSVIQRAVADITERRRWAQHYAVTERNSEWAHHQVEQVYKYDRWLAEIQEHFDSAVVYAEWCLWYESLPRIEKAKVKQTGGGLPSTSVSAPATERQRWFLGELGYDGPTDNLTKQEASALIGKLKGERQ